MGEDERCCEYYVWQVLFDCAECRNGKEKYRSINEQVIISSSAAGVESKVVEKRAIDRVKLLK